MKVTNLQKSQCRIGDDIKAEALRLGFDAVGFAHAAPVSHEAAKAFTQWIAEGKHDCMQWATNYTDLRLDPTRLVEGAQTVISLAVNYLPRQIQEADAPQVARYAYGSDYHEVVRDMARQLAAYIKECTGHESRVCVDSAPILERYWAQQAGLGFIGLNTLLIIPQRGSFFFLCELVTTLPHPRRTLHPHLWRLPRLRAPLPRWRIERRRARCRPMPIVPNHRKPLRAAP